MCRQYIREKHPGTAESDIFVYEDEGFSAKNMERPRFQKMLRDIRAEKPDFLVCYRLDRISRNVSDFSALIEDLNSRNISFICIKEEFDTSKPMGKAMMYIASVFAQLERETIAERVRDNLMMLARTGRWLGGTTPTGYTSEKVREIILDGRVKTACKLKDDPEELRVVDMMFEKYRELHSVAGVSKYLIRQGIRSRSGKEYSLPGIKQILQNPVYCAADRDAWEYFKAKGADVCFEEKECSDRFGLLVYNKRDYRKKSAPRQSMDKWIVAIGKHRSRVSGRDWVAVQNILADNVPTGKKPAKMHNDYSLLSGMIRCVKCGRRMFAKQRRPVRDGEIGYDYICEGKLRGGTALCDTSNLPGQRTDDEVCRHLMGYADGRTAVCDLLEKVRKKLREDSAGSPLQGVEERIRKCSGEADNLVQTLAQGGLSQAFVQRVNEKIRELDETLSALTKEREEYLRAASDRAERTQEIDTLAGKLSELGENWAALTVLEKRSLVRALSRRMEWDGEELHIFIDGGEGL